MKVVVVKSFIEVNGYPSIIVQVSGIVYLSIIHFTILFFGRASITFSIQAEADSCCCTKSIALINGIDQFNTLRVGNDDLYRSNQALQVVILFCTLQSCVPFETRYSQVHLPLVNYQDGAALINGVFESRKQLFVSIMVLNGQW